MKKSLAILMVLALVSGLLAVCSVTGSAAVAYVEETYSYSDILEEFGTHAEGEVQPDAEYNAYIYDEFTFGDGLWTYEYYDVAAEKFEPMTAYYATKQEGWVHSTWSNFYTSTAESAWVGSDYTYCTIGVSGKRMHPGDGAGATITFIVPAGGAISYDVSAYAYGSGNAPDQKIGDEWGTYLSLYVNDEKVYPTTEDDSNRLGYQNTSSASPYVLSCPSFSVKAGDRVRLVATAAANNNTAKGINLVSLPVITYHTAEVPVGNPNGIPPVGVMSNCPKDTLTCEVEWPAAKNAVSYNVYIKADGETEYTKVNDAPITDTKFTVTDLKSATLYELIVTSITAEGKESEPSEAIAFKSRKVDTPASDTPATDAPSTDAPATDAPATSDAPKTDAKDDAPDKGGFPIWILIVAIAAAVVVVVVVVIIVIVSKKKKALPEAEEK